MNTATTLSPEVTSKLARIGSEITGQPEARTNNLKEYVVVGQWFRSKGKDGVRRAYIVTAAAKPVYITAGQYLDGGNRTGLSDMDVAMIGLQPQEYVRVEISEPRTPNA